MELDIPESSGSTPQPKLEPLYPDNLEDVSDTDSLVTIDSSTKSDLYTIRNGRRHQALNEDVYTWAVDGEAAKLELLLGSVLSLTFPSGLCFEPSPGALAEVLTGLGEGRILDVGSGVVGDWALKMGESFPRSQVIGVDLVPSETEFAPSNVSFEVHDISEGLPYPDQSFSLIHLRGLSVAALPLLSEVARCLVPGGVLLICEPNNLLSSRTPNNPFLERALARRERDQPSYLDAVRQRWFQEICCRVSRHGAFEGVVDHWDEIGVGTKEGASEEESQQGAYMREACFAIWNLETSDEDMEEETRSALVASDREIIPVEDVGLFLQFRSVWARRRLKVEDGEGREM